MLIPIGSNASEYCINRFNIEIAGVNVELANRLNRQIEIDKEIRALFDSQDDIFAEIGSILASDPELKNPDNKNKITALTKESETIKRKRTELENEGYANNDRIIVLRNDIPKELQGEMRGCVAAVKPTNTLVNFGIQGFALAATGGLSLLLPEKTLYVDMGEVLHGKPLGGDKAIVPKARDDVLDSLGIGGDAEEIRLY